MRLRNFGGSRFESYEPRHKKSFSRTRARELWFSVWLVRGVFDRTGSDSGRQNEFTKFKLARKVFLALPKTMGVQTVDNLFIDKKKKGVVCFYGRFRSISTITAPTITITSIMAITAGKKYWSVID